MKKSLGICIISMGIILMTGCGNKFEPTETAVFVNTKGQVYSAVVEPFEQAYYDFEELTEDVNTMVSSYCAETNPEAVVVESLVEENDVVTLKMKYATVEDYAGFNDVILFSGTLQEAKDAGYYIGTVYDSEGNAVTVTPEEEAKLKVIVTEENICIQTTGKILYVSENVTILDKKLAKALEAEEPTPAFVLYK